MARHQPSPNRTPLLIARPAISGLLVAATAVFWAQPAMADDATSATATNIEQTADAVAPAVDVVDGVQSASGSVASVGEDASTLAPASGAGDVILTGESGIPLAVGLPSVADNAKAVLADGGSVVYDDPDGLADIVVQPLDSGMRIETVIKSADAPTSYAFDFSDGVVPTLNPDGSVDLVMSAAGVSMGVGRIATPWALDASGAPVPTEFVVADGHLSQVVHHVGANTVYPVVADPAFQGDCGIVTCTIRFDRATTNKVMLGQAVGATLLGLCAGLSPLPVMKVICVVVAGRLGIDRAIAGYYYGNGNCLGYRGTWVDAVVAWPVQITRNTYNCR